MSKEIQIEPENGSEKPVRPPVSTPDREAAAAPGPASSHHDLRPAQPDGKPVLSLLLAITLAVAVYFAVQTTGAIVPQFVVVVLALMSLTGLLAVFGALAGFVHFGRAPRQKEFFDQLFDAVGEPCVVSDARGLIVFSYS